MPPTTTKNAKPHKSAPKPKRKRLPTHVSMAETKAHILRMVATLDEAGEYVLTKRGKPIAKLIPFRPEPKPDIYGCMKKYGEVIFHGDIMEPLPPEEWGDLY